MAGKSLLSFSVAPLTVAAVFIMTVANANAYAIPSAGQPITQTPAESQPQTSSGFDTNYDFNNSFQSLVSPFQGFINSLQWSSSTTMSIKPSQLSLPPTNILPSAQNIFTQFDNWFYGLTGFRLSNFFVVILTGLSWVFGIGKNVVDWLLALVGGK